MRQPSQQKTWALWATLIVVVIMLYQLSIQRAASVIMDFNFSRFIKAVQSGHVDSVTFRDQGKIVGKIKPDFANEYNGTTFEIIGNTGDEVLKVLMQNNIVPNYESNEGTNMVTLMLNWLPILVICVMFFMFFRQIQAGGGKAMSFGKSRARLLTENKNKVTFKDVAGIEEAKDLRILRLQLQIQATLLDEILRD